MADKANDIRQEIKRGRQEIIDTRAAIPGTRTALENRVQSTIDRVNHAFDLCYQFKKHPWFMFGGSVLLGYWVRRQAAIRRQPSESNPSSPPQHSSEIRNQPNVDFSAIKGAAYGALASTLWSLAKLVPPLWDKQRKQ